MKQRIRYFDVAKGIGILCIIAGHMGIKAINDLVFTFHVPLFLIISGFFLPDEEGFWTYACRRFRNLIIPYYFCSICLILIRIPINIVYRTPGKIPSEMIRIFWEALYASGYNDNPTLFDIKQIGAIWFLWALFWALLLVKACINRKDGLLIVALVAVASYYTSKYVWLPLDLQAGGTAALFVYAGAMVKKRRPNLFDEANDALFLSGLLAFIISLSLGFQVYISINYFGKGIISVICALLISCFVIYASRYLETVSLLNEALIFFGRYSIIILCFHLIELNNINFFKHLDHYFSIPFQLQALLVFCMKLLFSVTCTFVVLRVKVLRNIFFR